MNTKALQTLDMSLPISSIEAYITQAGRIPMLTAEEEHDLATRLFEHNDLDAARKLILPHLRFVIKIARGYSGYGLALADLIQEGNVGLMKAVRRFDPNAGVRLVSFAVHWIKAEIHEFVLRNWRIVKIATTKSQRKLFFNLRKLGKRLGWRTEEEIQDVARVLNVTPEDVRTMEMRLNARDESYDPPIDDDSERAWAAPSNQLQDATLDPAHLLEHHDAKNHRESALMSAFDLLDARSQDILKQRWLDPEAKATLHDLAAKYNISAERIRQLEKNAMAKLKTEISDC